MTNVVKQLSENEIQHLEAKLPIETTRLGPGMRSKAKYQQTTITIYNSRKVMFQGNNAETVAAQLLGTTVTSNASQPSTKSTAPSYNQYHCIGSDEAGSGDYFGPLTVCACYVSQPHVEILKTLGVDDSKRLTDEKIVTLAEQLVTFLPHSLLVLNNPKYNDRHEAGWSQVKMKAVLHNECIKNVLQKIDTSELDYIVIDQFAEPKVYQRYALGEIPLSKQTRYETKGESKSLAIAAASIISRYAFVKHMEQLSHRFHLTIPKGASHKVDLAAAKLIEQYDIQTLDEVTKKHFGNRNKALNLINQKRKH
ncbi:ribonuclease HIII [Staphylococcus sp. 11261D007BR]